MSNKIKLSEIVKISGRVGWKGYTVDDLREEGPWVIGANDITTENRLDLSKAKHISREKFEESPEIKIELNDILIVKVGSTIGKVAIVNSDIGEACINPNSLILKNCKINPSYLYYYLISSAGQSFLRNNSSASAQSALNQLTLKEMLIDVVDDQSQQSISSLLNNLNSKIELNNRINAELEAMAKTLYDYWFVQFDFPDAQGRPYKSSGGKMVWSGELGREVPEGWKIKKLGKAIKIIRGASPRPIDNFLSDKGTPWVKISDATKTDNRFITETKQFIIEEGVSSSRSVSPNTLILSNSASPAIPRIMKIQACVHDGWLIIEGYSEGLTPEFMFHFFDYERPRIITLGSGSIFKNLKTDYLKDFKFINPPKSIVELITPQLKTISETIYIRTLENQKLAELRDWLLPMLMNGQVKVA